MMDVSLHDPAKNRQFMQWGDSTYQIYLWVAKTIHPQMIKVT